MQATRVADPSVETDPATHGRPPRSRTFVVLRRFVVALLGLNLLVLALLVAVTVAGDDDAAESTAAADVPDVEGSVIPSTTEAPSDQSPVESPDEITDETPEPVDVVTDVDGVVVTGDAVEPIDVEPAISTEPPPYPEPFEPTANETQPDAKRMGAFVAYLITLSLIHI